MHYRIVMPPHIGAAQILQQTLAWLKEDRAMQADRARLRKPAASRRSTRSLDRAPTANNGSGNILRGLLRMSTAITQGQVCTRRPQEALIS